MKRSEVVSLRNPRGYLPHARGNDSWQFVTFRLKDSLPRSLLDAHFAADEPHCFSDFDELMDRGLGSCLLAKRECGSLLVDLLRQWLSARVHVDTWVIMPNHVHLILRLPKDQELSRILQAFKSRSALRINKLMNRSGSLWQRDYFDRQLIDLDAILKTRQYVEENPVSAGLCRRAEEWIFSSAFVRDQEGLDTRLDLSL